MKFKNKIILIPILVIIFMLSIKLFLLFNSNLGFNEAVYKYIADQINQGKLPYKDIFDHKSPLVYYSLACFFKIFGSSTINMHILALIFDIFLMLTIFLITKKIYNIEIAIYSSALYSVFINFVYYDTEIPMTLFGLLGVFLYLLALEKNKYLYLFFSGILLAISVWFKQPGILFFISVMIHLIFLVYKKQLKFKQAGKNLYFIIAGSFVFSLPLLSYFIYSLGFKTFFYHIITFNIKFSGSTSRILQIGKLFQILIFNFGVLFAIILAFYKNLAKENYPCKNKFFIILLTILLLFFLANKEIFFNHLIQLVPFVILLSVSSLLLIREKKIKKFIIILLIIVMLNFSLITLESVARKVRDKTYKQQEIVVSYIKQNISEKARVFSDSAIYYTLTNFSCSYKVCFLAPSVASVFSFDDFCNYIREIDYLFLTHRKKYLGEKNLKCIEDKFILQKKFDNVDESYVEIWKRK